MRQNLRRTYKLAALALVSSRAAPSVAFVRRFPIARTIRVSKTRMSSTSPPDEIIFSSPDLQVHHLKYTVDSTQEEAKRLLREQDEERNTLSLAVIADDQKSGRGTSGRTWHASRGNLYLTCAIPMGLIPLSKITLLPLVVGVVVAEILAGHSKIRPTVKWPNDVLISDQKISGTLIENFRVEQQDWWLVGIGVNIESCPQQLPPEKTDFHPTPRSVTCLREHTSSTVLPTAVDFGSQISNHLVEWIGSLKTDAAGEVISKWKSWADMGQLYTIRETGEQVTTVDLQTDGQLKVIGSDGRERLLVSDYLY
jgi:BirA family biotin operon repressor/biotin-[acetyl-CoA-carboxylase] ligase